MKTIGGRIWPLPGAGKSPLVEYTGLAQTFLPPEKSTQSMKIRRIGRWSWNTILAYAALMWSLAQPAHLFGDVWVAKPSVQDFIFGAAPAMGAPPASATNTPNPQQTTQPAPVDSHTRSKAGFMAGAGLAILSLLILAAGLALLRAFRQR